MNDVVMSENNSVISLSDNDIFAFGGYNNIGYTITKM